MLYDWTNHSQLIWYLSYNFHTNVFIKLLPGQEKVGCISFSNR